MSDDLATFIILFGLVCLVSVAAIARISSIAANLRKQHGKTSRKIAVMMFCTCAEIFLVTSAIFFIRMIWIWAGLRIAGIIVQAMGVEVFQRYLDKLGEEEQTNPPSQQ